MKLLCVVILACVSLSGCATGHISQPEGELTADRLLRVEDKIDTHSEAIAALRGAGILREITGKRRDRVYAYHDYLQVLTKDTE